MTPDATSQLIIALDLPTRREAEALIEKIGDRGLFYKIGYQLIYGDDGLGLVRALKDAGKSVFCDVKLLDIPNTVEQGVAGLVNLGADMVTIHAEPQCMAAARRAVAGAHTKLMGVTVLTSSSNQELKAGGYACSLPDLVERRARQAAHAGIDGVICSAQEVALVSQASNGTLITVTPGIRPSGDAQDDQKRTATPAGAIDAGADYLVIGRPVYRAKDPCSAVARISQEIFAANDQRINVRSAGPVDAEHLRAIASNVAAAFDQDHRFWLIELGGEPAGFLQARPVGDVLVCVGMSILPRHLSKGIGEKLVDHFERVAKSEGFRGVAGRVADMLPAEGQLYDKHGFTRWSDDMVGSELRSTMAYHSVNRASETEACIVVGKWL